MAAVAASSVWQSTPPWLRQLSKTRPFPRLPHPSFLTPPLLSLPIPPPPRACRKSVSCEDSVAFSPENSDAPLLHRRLPMQQPPAFVPPGVQIFHEMKGDWRLIWSDDGRLHEMTIENAFDANANVWQADSGRWVSGIDLDGKEENSPQVLWESHSLVEHGSWPFGKKNEIRGFAGGILKQALLIGLVSMAACSSVLADTEIASVDQSGSWIGDLGDVQNGLVSAFLLTFFSEIGDKTFFIAALLAARNSNAAVFTGTFGALVAMTFISVVLGRTFHYIDAILPFSLGKNELPLDDIAAVVLLVYFGVSTLIDASSMDGSKSEEEQQEAELAIAGVSGGAAATTAVTTFALVFVAEWGDKSFFSTIALAAASSPLGVVAGAIAGHGIATILAVLGGSILASYVSEKVISYTGGILFLAFAVITLVEIFKP